VFDAMNVSHIQVVCMVLAKNHGSASATRDGVVYSVTKTLIFARITNLVRIMELVSTPARDHILATVHLVLQALIVKPKSAIVRSIHV
jgi:hypothetical protein